MIEYFTNEALEFHKICLDVATRKIKDATMNSSTC